MRGITLVEDTSDYIIFLVLMEVNVLLLDFSLRLWNSLSLAVVVFEGTIFTGLKIIQTLQSE